jgi:MFS family permease
MTQRRWYVLAVLTLVYTFNIADRYAISTLIEPIKADLHLTDTAIGFLTGTALAIFYTGMGIPLGLLADRVNRRNLIALSIAIWSVMTAACGAARTFTQLLLARIGVGVGEAGGTPGSQSMISDLFPFKQRALATLIFALGASAGSMLGSVVGGSISDRFGWRWAFLVLGIPGVLIALLLRLTVREPKRGAYDAVSDSTHHPPTLGETLRFMLQQKALLHTLAGSALVVFWGWGLLWWTPAFLMRSYGLTTSMAGGLIGTISGIAGTLGILAGAWVIHKSGQHDPRWQPWVVALATVFGAAASVAAYGSYSRSITVLMLWLFVPVAYLNIGPQLALTQSLVKPRMRALSCAVLLFVVNFANLALAPQLIGLASDVLNAHTTAGHESLRIALTGTTVFGFWAAYHWWAAGRLLPADLRRAGTI